MLILPQSPLPSLTQVDPIYDHSACSTQFPDRITAFQKI